MKGILQLRQNLNISQQELATYLNVTRSAIAMAENNKRDLPTDALIKVAELEASLSSLRSTKGSDMLTNKMSLVKQEKQQEHTHKILKAIQKAEYKAFIIQGRLNSVSESARSTQHWLHIVENLLLKTDDTNTERYYWLKLQQKLHEQRLVKYTEQQVALNIDIAMLTGQASTHRQLHNSIIENTFL